MRAATILRTVWLLILLVVLAASGVYALRYVQIWEWQRALWAGIVFLATLLVTSVLLLLSRIGQLERRLDALAETSQKAIPPGSGVEAARAEPSPEPTPEFPWLKASSTLSSRQVFMPILLGAGVLVSLIASLVERLARYATTRRELSAATRPVGGRALRLPDYVVGVVAGAVMIIAASIGIYRVTTYQPDPSQPGTREYVVDVAATLSRVRPVEVTRAVSDFCGINTRTWVRVESVELIAERRTRLVVSPLLAAPAERRFQGCLEDRTIERHQLRVVSVVSAPAGAAESES